MHSFLFSLLLVVFRSYRAIFYPQIFLKSQKLNEFAVEVMCELEEVGSGLAYHFCSR
jgi:hypothetical protein